jgi:aminopeptidase N
MRRKHLVPSIILSFVALTAAAGQPVHHDLQVTLDPSGRSLEVVDTLGVVDRVTPDADGGFRFVLHAGLAPTVDGEGWTIEAVDGPVSAGFFGINATTDTVADTVPLEGWRLIPDGNVTELPPPTVRYAGVIHHPLAQQGEEYQRSFSETPGIIDGIGVFLAGTSFWVPRFGDHLLTFSLEAGGAPVHWDLVSQGRRSDHTLDEIALRTVTWTMEHPTEEIYLVGGPLEVYEDAQDDVAVYVYLRRGDPALATRYLDATKRYLRLYESILPDYPFASFALVENFWETGYGMPGFTLLGPRIIRFPWILTSSYPHELLHNWWGNSAYVDFEQGNWCEGITAYMADHLFAEQRGEGAVYRRSTLKKYSDYVRAGQDFPLSEFRSRHSSASEAVGYGKSMMLFHMLRRALGDEAFLAGLNHFYEDHRFTRASFADIAESLTETSGGAWGPLVEEWITRTGAPRLEIVDLDVASRDDNAMPWELRLSLRQADVERPFTMTIPVAVTLEGAEEAVWVEAGSCSDAGVCTLRMPFASRPIRVDVDPAFDVMRRLDPMEVPPALTTVFGSPKKRFILPSDASDEELDAWRKVAADWAAPDDPEILLDSDVETLPDGAVFVLGWTNRHADAVVARLESHGVARTDAGLRIGDQTVDRAGHSAVLVARGADDPTAALALVTADPMAAIPGLGRKLPHYGKYSFLGFKGDEPQNMAKGQWQPVASPLVRNLTDGPLPALVLPARFPLAELPPMFDAASFRRTVEFLADPRHEGRGVGSPGLERTMRWVEDQFKALGLHPIAEEGYLQRWAWRGGDPERMMPLTNLIGGIPGADPELENHPVVVMAHLDHLGLGWPDVREGNEGMVHPGADDNASGVAALLELARAMRAEPPRPRPVVFVVTTAEEAGLVGARHFVANLAEHIEPFACVNLDTVGRLADGQLYILNADSAREWRFIFMGVGYTTGAPVAVVEETLDSSDQVACLEAGIPAVQLFTGPTADYHRPTDTADTLDYEGLSVVTEAAKEAVGYLAERTDSLTVTISEAEPEATATEASSGSRRASLGTMPDFAFSGEGVRVQQVTPGSAAEAAGVLPGDVLTEFNGQPVADLRSYSAVLKACEPGDSVAITVLRDGEEVALTATLGQR